MGQDFDFDKVGKRMPYRVPDEFFRNLEKTVLDRVAGEDLGSSLTEIYGGAGKPKAARIWRFVSSAAAAVVVLFALGGFMAQRPSARDYMANIETAYSSLTEDEQEFLASLYEDDIFFNDDI